MTIEHLDTIDMISNDEESETVTLFISDHLEWHQENNKLLLLQEKLNKYLAFLESGEVYKNVPRIKHGNFIISLTSRYRPVGEGITFLGLVQDTIEGAGFKFNWGPLHGGYIDDNS